MAWAQRKRERGIEFGGVEGVIDTLELQFGLWLRGGANRDGQAKIGDVDVEEIVETRDRTDGTGSERSPGTYLTDVPPEMLGVRITDVDIELTYQSWGRVW